MTGRHGRRLTFLIGTRSAAFSAASLPSHAGVREPSGLDSYQSSVSSLLSTTPSLTPIVKFCCLSVMMTQQLPSSLPLGWEPKYDGASERWFFVHQPTGFTQLFFPKAGDEKIGIPGLVQPQPTTPFLSTKMEAMNISGTAHTVELVQNQESPAMQTALPQYQQSHQQQFASPLPLRSNPHASAAGQHSLSQVSALARTGSNSIQRKPIPRRDSVQSQGSSSSSQTAPQPSQQYQVMSSHIPSSTAQYTQSIQPGEFP